MPSLIPSSRATAIRARSPITASNQVLPTVTDSYNRKLTFTYTGGYLIAGHNARQPVLNYTATAPAASMPRRQRPHQLGVVQHLAGDEPL